MDVDIVSWLGLALRWFHVLIGILWIGASFYFIWLDNSLRPPKDDKDPADGELWAVHGGGFYHNKKYLVAPAHLPENLHWFKWEAYLTWISGIALLCLIYYLQANIFLIDASKMELQPWQAISFGIIFIFGGFMFYEVLCEFCMEKSNAFFGFIWFFFLTMAGFVLCQIFSDRAAFMHVGAIIGTVMAANVFVTIIPNQKIVVADLLAGKKPDPKYGRIAKQRSVHNNYMTLPILLIMIINHYPMVFSHDYNWLILAMLGASAWPLREFFNQKHKGNKDYRYIVAGFIGFLLVIAFASYSPQKHSFPNNQTLQVSDTQVRLIMNKHCIQCHSDTPTHESVDIAPAGIMFDKIDEIKKYNSSIFQQAVSGDAMPQGNETGMSQDERDKLGIWLKAQK